MRHLMLATLLLSGCLLITSALAAQPSIGLDGYSAAPPRPYIVRAPQPFEVVTSRHVFHDSRLPRVADTQPSVIIRRYDADLGVYTDAVVRDREPRPPTRSAAR
ncbi:hypothetical protein DCO48_13580 [Pseudomonas sp. SDI]|uniref:hypothetical protein n=1 Tax=Pseudomonas sp. SDI TaxID=2170734 RepID=UPI000DE77AC9|nr:hypothetical protein [Pseudomonas sp. SDI]PWB32364.1 hypothetical protein DCO48_13580 [Pseudomonas sp. SDI]